MKKALIFLLVLLLTACGPAKPALNPDDSSAPSASPIPAESEFYKNYQEMNTRPYAVMVDNDNKDAWPHRGLDKAYLVYEINVEGGATRFLALFDSREKTEIGPIRSSRHYFLDYALENNAIYTHFGWSPKAQSDIPALGINNINGVIGSDAGCFWRENKYAGDYHSAYTSIEKISKMVSSKGYETSNNKLPLNLNANDKEIDGSPASIIRIPYAGFYRVGYEYDAENAVYKRYMNGNAHAMKDGAVVTAKNVLILKVPTSPLGNDPKRIELYNTGSGKGYYFTLGKYIDITWEKSSRSGATVYKDANGKVIKLNPGPTWISMIPGHVSAEIVE